MFLTFHTIKSKTLNCQGWGLRSDMNAMLPQIDIISQGRLPEMTHDGGVGPEEQQVTILIKDRQTVNSKATQKPIHNKMWDQPQQKDKHFSLIPTFNCNSVISKICMFSLQCHFCWWVQRFYEVVIRCYFSTSMIRVH